MENSVLENWEKRFIACYEAQGRLADGSHDLGHFQRVWRVAREINREEGEPADPVILLASAYFHDLVALPKNHPDRREASRLSAERAVELLRGRWEDFPVGKIEGVRHAIHAHSYSAGVAPVTAEAKILQDADRMEAVGAIGLARVWYSAGQMGQSLFDAADPLAERRVPDDQRFALDHFQLKLLRLPALMNTATGRRMAEIRAGYLREFLDRICREIRGA
ncbi:MAG TPA: HD domain-containing protein [Puia sp.]|nr:HD domain-containing protein [Puia sp.]